MDYQETLNFLFNRLQSFHNQGAKAYKPGLEKALRLSAAFGNPHTLFRSIHVGGTNGKGSTAHSLASVLMASGMRVGLYTSPHLIDFSERIRVDGQPISREEVIDFVERFIKKNLTDTDPSFFELTTIMAFEHFARHNVDIAIIEVGLGGRLDTTNIITPLLSVITNVALDHTNLLGDTLSAIATEKAGIIKPGVTAVVGRRNPETDFVFSAKEDESKIVFAQDTPLFRDKDFREDTITYTGTPWGEVVCCLTGDCQPENMQTVLTSLRELEKLKIISLNNKLLNEGLKNVCSSTGLMGRWMKLHSKPLVIADTAHNPDGWKDISLRLHKHNPSTLHIVIGFASDKDFGTILSLLPASAKYYFVRPSTPRGALASDIMAIAERYGINGAEFPDVAQGYEAAMTNAGKQKGAMVYVGGSNFVVADLLNYLLHKSGRCPWCGNDPLYVKYHDEEWGRVVKDDRRLFEFLVLEGAQAGLSWLTVLRKRENYRKAFHNFDFIKVSQMTSADVEMLMKDKGIIRNRLKIQSAITNATLFPQIIKEFGSFYNYVLTFLPNGKRIVNSIEDIGEIPTKTEVSDAMSKDMKKRGFKFVGSTICYAFLQATGFIDDHLNNCPCKNQTALTLKSYNTLSK